MNESQILQKQIFDIAGQKQFSESTLKVFKYQYNNNPTYREYIQSLGKDISKIGDPAQIPFLPVEFFRTRKIISGVDDIDIIFQSSGTTGSSTSKHFVRNIDLYEKSFMRSFRLFYGEPEEYLIAALLPSYTEREGSSLIYMADYLIKKSLNPKSGFYKGDDDGLITMLASARNENRKILLLGVSFALLDLSENYAPDLSGIIIMETGGMKGRRKEITRAELHSILKTGFNVPAIHSEYGMTELLSQSYSKGDGIFYSPPWMKIIIRDPLDPLTVLSEPGQTGGINVIDLANINSCSFIATGDLGRVHEDGGFEVLGRFDNSDIRGCNLMVE